MKKLLLITFLGFAFCLCANAQTVPNADEVQRTQLVNALERAQTEVKASRKYIEGLTEQIAVKDKRIKALNEKDVLSGEAIAGLQSEISNLRAAIVEAQAALEIRKNEVAELKKDLDKTRRKLHRAREFTKFLAITAGILGAIVILK